MYRYHFLEHKILPRIIFLFLIQFLVSACVNIEKSDKPFFLSFASTEGFDEAYDFCCDSSGNFFVTGVFSGDIPLNNSDSTSKIQSAGDLDIFVAKINKLGQIVWLKSFGGTQIDEAAGICMDQEGNLYVGGYFSSRKLDGSNRTNPFPQVHQSVIIKMSGAGKFLDCFSFSSPGNNEIYALEWNGLLNRIVITGYSSDTLFYNAKPISVINNQSHNLFVATISSDLHLDKFELFGDEAEDEGRCLSFIESGIVIGGHIGDENCKTGRPAILLLNDSLKLIADYSFNSTSFGSIGSIACTSGRIIALGNFSGKLPANNLLYERDGFIACFDNKLNFDWAHGFKSNGNNWGRAACFINDQIHSFQVVNDSTYYPWSKELQIGGGEHDILYCMFDLKGNYIWSKQLMQPGEQGVNKILFYNNKIYACGWYYLRNPFSINSSFRYKNYGDAFFARIPPQKP